MAKGLFDCTGKVTLVTGGNSGIGLGFARGVAKVGGDVVIWARNAERNAEAAEDLLKAGAGRVRTYQVDVTSEEQVIEGYKQLVADLGRIDCVFANSGRSAKQHALLDMPTEEWHDLLNLNLHGTFFTLREGARAMVKRAEAGEPGGSLVGCGSLSMFQGLAGRQNYAASKGALGAIIRGMAVEFGKYNIRANTIAPGFIVTGMMAGAQQVVDMFAQRTPIGRAGQPEDFEGIGAFLASDASSFVTGETITVDGGYMVRPM
ncbi:SDR family NAD(P)-dependent oxidoreductase [Caulobacter soli]|uniref:SDR family NAD(P)-dependent oxidoreductase n=1 Tax=Caulobacter soli TaxID=2708539 RepID=UPI0013ECED62|nr:SDR family oxidoreductase [Caulobacter soli]